MLWNRLAVVTALALGTFSIQALAEPVTLDAKASKIDFVGKKKDGQHAGGFKTFTADANANFDAPEQSSLKIVIDTTSLWSDNDKLTNHLKNPDFFDVRKYPKITFDSTKLVTQEEGQGKIIGDLTMLGKTHELMVPVKTVVSDDQIVVDADFLLDRTKWGMTYGEGNIENDVLVKAHLVFKR